MGREDSVPGIGVERIIQLKAPCLRYGFQPSISLSSTFDMAFPLPVVLKKSSAQVSRRAVDHVVPMPQHARPSAWCRDPDQNALGNEAESVSTCTFWEESNGKARDHDHAHNGWLL